jgi:hypothetical protein
MPAGAVELAQRDRPAACDAPLRNAGRPLEGAAVRILELEMRGRKTKAVEPLEEESEPRRAGELAVCHDL